MKIAVCPGSFDPLTLGHLSIIRRASRLFDKVVVLIMTNSGKTPFFSIDDRLSFIKRCVSDITNVTVDSASGLLADYLKEIGGCAIVKGVRAFSDFEYEFQMALANKKINPQVETIFLVKDINYINLIISSIITICFTLITNRLMKKKIKNINMIDSLKSIE